MEQRNGTPHTGDDAATGPAWTRDPDALLDFLRELRPQNGESGEDAIGRIGAALRVAVHYDSPVAEACISRLRSELLREIGDVARSISASECALETSRRIDNPREIIASLMSLAACRMHLGNPAETFALLAEAESIARQRGSRSDVAEVLTAISSSHGRMRAADKAFEYALMVEQEYLDTLVDEAKSTLYNNLAAASNDMGRFADALPYVEAGLRALETTPNEIRRAFLQANHAVALSRTHRLEEVAAIVQEVEEIAHRRGHQLLVAGMMEELGVAYLTARQPSEALPCLLRAKASLSW